MFKVLALLLLSSFSFAECYTKSADTVITDFCFDEEIHNYSATNYPASVVLGERYASHLDLVNCTQGYYKSLICHYSDSEQKTKISIHFNSKYACGNLTSRQCLAFTYMGKVFR